MEIKSNSIPLIDNSICMLAKNKKIRLFDALKGYSKKYLSGNLSDLDESGTRLMVNYFLTDVLGYAPIEEVKTEYMIRGTYADYVLQTNGTRHFLVEVKALSIGLSEKHLRQAINYGANEGIEWALLTNGKVFDFYKILFNKPIESKKIFSFDLSDPQQLKANQEVICFLHRDCVNAGGLEDLWGRFVALDPCSVAQLLYSTPVINHLKKELKRKYKVKFGDDDVIKSLNRILVESVTLDGIKPIKKKKRKKEVAESVQSGEPLESGNELSNAQNQS